jgi:hypothetical protein
MSWKEAREAGKTCERCREARAAIHAAGFLTSEVYDHSDEWCAAQSVETHGPAFYNHPKAYVQVKVKA